MSLRACWSFLTYGQSPGLEAHPPCPMQHSFDMLDLHPQSATVLGPGLSHSSVCARPAGLAWLWAQEKASARSLLSEPALPQARRFCQHSLETRARSRGWHSCETKLLPNSNIFAGSNSMSPSAAFKRRFWHNMKLGQNKRVTTKCSQAKGSAEGGVSANLGLVGIL